MTSPLTSTPTPPTMPMTITRPELIVDGSDHEFRELVHGLLAVAARHQRIRARHAAYIDLSAAAYTVLIAAAHLSGDGPVTTKAVAEHLFVTPAFITMEANKLEKQGLLAKARSVTDARVVELSITELGLARLEKLAVVQRQVNDVEFDRLSHRDFEQLRHLVRVMVDNCDRALAFHDYLTSGSAGATGEHAGE